MTEYQCFELHENADIANSPRSPAVDTLIEDCLGASLEYLGNGTDIQHFRRTCTLFNRIYDQYKVRQNEKFRNFRLLFERTSGRNKYRTLEEFLNSVPMAPDVYVDFGIRVQNVSTHSGHPFSFDVSRLMALHLRSRKNVVRGLSAIKKLPFLSILLWNDMDWGMDPILLVNLCYNATIFAMICRSTTVIDFPANISTVELKELLYRQQIRFQDDTQERILWTIGKRCCSAHLRYELWERSYCLCKHCTLSRTCFAIACILWWIPACVCWSRGLSYHCGL